MHALMCLAAQLLFLQSTSPQGGVLSLDLRVMTSSTEDSEIPDDEANTAVSCLWVMYLIHVLG